MKRLLFIICLLIGTLSLFAQPRSEKEAIQIAQDFFGKKAKSRNPKLSVIPQQKIESQIRKKIAPINKQDGTNSSFYIVNDEANSRFVIVSADERLFTILGYSDTGLFTIEESPDGLLDLLNEYNKQYDLIKALGNVTIKPKKIKENLNPVLPLLSTQWNQGAPYNTQCPQYSGSNCVTGCVATAMAQVMAYHKHPDKGQNGVVYYQTGTLGIFQLLNYNSLNFDWNKITDTYNSNNTEDQINEVAKLMHACGVSVFMDYNTSKNGGSGANPCNIPYALIHYFGYNPNIYYAAKDYYSRAEWDDLIINELQEKRPILYGGRGSLGGHRFVLDGVDSNGLYHFNFGWSGSNDGYYELDALNPLIYNFSSEQSMVLLISKDTIGKPLDVFYSDNFTLGSTVAVGNTTKAKFNPTCYSNKSNTQTAKFEGVYGIGVFDKDWNFVKSLYSSNISFNVGSSYYFSKSVDVKFDAAIFTENSQYYIALYAQGDNAVAPTVMRTSMGNNDWYRSTTKDGVVTLELLKTIDDNPVTQPDPEWPEPITGNLKMLALDNADEYKIWDVSIVQDGTDAKKYWFKGIDYVVSERGYTTEKNWNTVYGIVGDNGNINIPVSQQLGENLFLNNFSSEGDLTVMIAQDGSMMKIIDKWGTIERKKSGDNTTQDNISVYTSATFYPVAPVPIETPIIVINENHMMTIACGTEGAIIYYTLDEKTPTMSSARYTSTLPIDRNLVIKAVAIKDANTSEIALLTVNDYVVSMPSFTESDNKVYITCHDADHIYYTTDGNTPTTDTSDGHSKLYSDSNPPEFNETTTLKAIGTHEGWNDSEVATYELIVPPPIPDIIVENNVQGQLATRIPTENKLTTKSLTITGELNGTDITVIREMLVDGNLEYLDIKGCSIKAGGDKYPYLSLSYETEDNIIGRCMFARANKLKAIVLPDNIVKVNNSAFSYCELLKEVTIPEGCTEIEYAFTFCNNLEIVNLPNSLIKFASNDFAYCPNITAINVGENNQNFKSEDGVLYSKDGKTLIRFPNNKCTHYTILDGVGTIGASAFYCSNIENVILPNTVISIERSAFYSSEKMKNIVFPNSVVRLGDNAFYNCSSLASVTLSSQISDILSGTFLRCTNLKSIEIPENVKEIDGTAFNYCYSLQRFEVNDTNPYYSADDGVIYSKDKKSLVRCPIALYSEDFRIQEGVKEIADNAFMGCKNIVKFTLPLSVDTIGQYAFKGCSIKSILLSDNIRQIGYEAFSYCDSLKTFVIPSSLEEIAESMFILDNALSFVKIHKDVNKIGRSAFRFCKKLSTIDCNIRNIESVNVGDLAFDGIADDCAWYVPYGTKEKYKAQPWWVTTWSIVENPLAITIVKSDGTDGSMEAQPGDDVVINDEIRSISVSKDIPLHSISYVRTFNNTNWQSLYVPFDLTVNDALLEEFDFAYINGAKQYDRDDDGIAEEMTIEIFKVKNKTLRANTPYLIRARATGTKTITINEATLYSTEANSIDCSTTALLFTFTGSYEALNYDALAGCYLLGGGTWNPVREGGSMKPLRFFLKIESRDFTPFYAPAIRLTVYGEDDEATEIKSPLNEDDFENESSTYVDLQGRKVGHPVNGLYIINGKKVFVK